MITGFTQASAYQYNDILRSNHACRYRSFITREKYDVPTWKDLEYDQYDNLTTVYLTWRDDTGEVRATTRLAPTDRRYMIKDLWPEYVTKIELPHSPTIWEASRMCVDNTLPPETRRKILNELVYAYQEICLINNIEYMIGVMPPKIWDHVFGKAGWDIEQIGPISTLDTGEEIVVGRMNVSAAIMENIIQTTGLDTSPLKITTELNQLTNHIYSIVEEAA